MDLTKIVSISGKPGLFKIAAQAKNSVVVESLLDGKRFPAFSHDRMSTLEEISIFTTTEDMLLKEVFRNIKDKMGDTLDFEVKSLSNEELRQKFAEVVPDYDMDAVYPSDIKKVFSWYQLLMEKELLDFTEAEPEPDAEATDQVKDEPTDETEK